MVPEEFLIGAACAVEGTLRRLGLDLTPAQANQHGSEQDRHREEEAAVKALVDFREAVRNAARENAPWGEIYKLCDEVRDVIAPGLGWKIVDGKGRSTFSKK